MSEKKSCHNCLNVSKYTDDKGDLHMSCDEYGFFMLGSPANCDPPHDDACNYWTDDPQKAKNSKDYFVARIVTNEEMQCNGYMDFLCRNLKEQISNGILAIVSDGNEYAIKMLPEQYIKKPDMLSVEIRKGISVKELVRCKECKYCYAEGFVNVRNVCEKHYDFGNVDDDWFCADGERKEQEQE